MRGFAQIFIVVTPTGQEVETRFMTKKDAKKAATKLGKGSKVFSGGLNFWSGGKEMEGRFLEFEVAE